ncbi:MAG: hypothetical protein CMQ20_00890 [Gammaproteobacteria bacterium]|jgi:hypothetical protein|nr:hypothetical protein [Gammaproteobacteria bacterium]|tara:strand:- start:3067 stop:4248 length:1182 start_codon:yes stop_codon:yes gene_type:complete
MLSQYDEFPVHQTGHPFSRSAVSNYSFDDGYFFGVFSADRDMFLFMGMRINPNNNMIGGYAAMMCGGIQQTVRFKRPWQGDMDTRIGPYAYRFIKPFEEIQLLLEENDSDLSFNLSWLATAPAFEEAHHFATNHHRVMTDQTRYSQAGSAAGWIRYKGELLTVQPGDWCASRDHSWGQYYERPPLAPQKRWLSPLEQPGARRALRLWILFSTPLISGFFGLHEDSDGNQLEMNDRFGTPFEGMLGHSSDGNGISLVSADHYLEFEPGGLLMKTGRVTLTDTQGNDWLLELEATGKPWWPHTIGYNLGSWKDGGSMVSYPGSDELQSEWDEFDFSRQPFDHITYSGQSLKQIFGPEFLCFIKVTLPDGQVASGSAQTELVVTPPYKPYGFHTAL